MKVIFLDFDGVLNSATSFLYEEYRRKILKEQNVKGPVNETLSLHCCAALNHVLDQYPEVKIVISSAWRELFDIDSLKRKLEEYHIDSKRVVGITPSNRLEGRGAEIKSWLDAHPEVDHYIIIDDNDWGISEVHSHRRFVQTDWDRGMGFNHAEEAIGKLSNVNKKLIEELASETASTETKMSDNIF